MAATLDDMDWPVATARLILRRAVPEDAEVTWRYRRLDAVNQWITAAPQTFLEYQRHFLEPDRLAKTLVVELGGSDGSDDSDGSDHTVIGDLMFGVQDAWSQQEVADQAKGVEAELGWVLDPEYGGQGYATEAVEAMVRIAFERLGQRRVIANCFADNVASWRLMERIGMRRETYTVRESLHRSGRWLDGMSYALLAEEWTGSGGSIARR